MSVFVFVWYPRSPAIGHASLLIAKGPYISWWPDSQQTNAAKAASGRQQSFQQDFTEERRNPDFYSAPITNLDTAAMIEFWTGVLQEKEEKWRLLGNNCSTMVLRTLLAGGLKEKYPAVNNLIVKNVLFATPITVKDVAEAVTGSHADRALGHLKYATRVEEASIAYNYVLKTGVAKIRSKFVRMTKQ